MISYSAKQGGREGGVRKESMRVFKKGLTCGGSGVAAAFLDGARDAAADAEDSYIGGVGVKLTVKGELVIINQKAETM